MIAAAAGPPAQPRRRRARAGSPCAQRHRPVIAKTFLSAKTFRAYGTNFFRQEKSFRDHDGTLGRSMQSEVT
jgi:hypothetical protein